MQRLTLVLFVTAFLLSFNTTQVFSQQEALEEEEFLTEEWLLGDVIALDLENNQLRVSYIDYATDEEKEIAIRVDADTKYDNVSSLAGVKVGDVVSVGYIIHSEAEAIALHISVEEPQPDIIE